jgi:hypothetical protein
MHQIRLIPVGRAVRPTVVEFYTIPIRGPDDYCCELQKSLSFEQAREISRDLANGRQTGEIGEWKWEAGEFSVCPICDRSVEDGVPLCSACESVLAQDGKAPDDGRGMDR